MPHNEYIREIENSETAYLFIHGIIGSPDHFNKLIDLVPEKYSIYNILLDGHGKSLKDFAQTSIKKWEDQVNNLMKYLTTKYQKIIIVGHSMGTLFAINSALNHPKFVTDLFLLSVPLKVKVKPMALTNFLKVVFNKVDSSDPAVIAAKNSWSITGDKKIWRYLTWMPRYFELFLKIYKTDKRLSALSVSTTVFHSENDEVVSNETYKILKEYKNINTIILSNSGHMYYPPQDYNLILNEFKKLCKK